MIIGGIQKNSLIDFPSKISCVIFTAGCNFICPYCHNPELVNPPFRPIAPEEIFDFLHKRKSLLDGVAITGGEPTLHNDLLDFCKTIQSMGFPVKIDTNGSRPEVIHSLIEKNLVDYLAMDVKTLPENYVPHFSQQIHPEAIIESINVIKSSGRAHEFRTTCVKPFVDADIIRQIARHLDGADRYVLQRANINKSVLNPPYFENRDWKCDTTEISAYQKDVRSFVNVKEVLIR